MVRNDLYDSDLKLCLSYHEPHYRSIWYGVQASIGGDCMKAMLRAIWPSVNDIRA